MPSRIPKVRFAWLSLGTAVVVLALKLLAWRMTASVGLLSDALETFSNVGGALMAVLMLRVAARPPDEGHAFGHSKAEYFSSGFEGILVVVAAGLIIAEAVRRLLAPRGLEAIGAGLSVAVVAGLINLAVARVLLHAGRRHGSVALTADGRHLMTDVWTTVGVVVGVALAAATGWRWVDPLVALLVALQVLRTGASLIHESAMGLMDAAWPARDRARLAAILDEFRRAHAPGQIDFHAVRTRRSANRRFVALHILVPGSWTVREAHDLAERVEQRIVHVFPNAIAFTHVEPLEDPRSYDAQALDRRL